MLNHKVDDIVEIEHIKQGHGFKIGQKVRIVELCSEGSEDEHYQAESLDGSEYWWIGDDEILQE